MKGSFEGMGQWAATFACETVTVGQVVKVSGNGAVTACGSGEGFDGVVLAAARDGRACSVVMGGMVTAAYSGDTAPSAGWNALKADGKGGVSVTSGGKQYLAVDVDTAAKTVTFVL